MVSYSFFNAGWRAKNPNISKHVWSLDLEFRILDLRLVWFAVFIGLHQKRAFGIWILQLLLFGFCSFGYTKTFQTFFRSGKPSGYRNQAGYNLSRIRHPLSTWLGDFVRLGTGMWIPLKPVLNKIRWELSCVKKGCQWCRDLKSYLGKMSVLTCDFQLLETTSKDKTLVSHRSCGIE